MIASYRYLAVQFENIVAKYRGKSTRDALLVGNDVHIGGMRSNSKSAFESGVLINSATFEHTLDYVFSKLRIDTERIYHPIVMSEALCTPSYSRKLVSELLFEGYQVPSVAYGIDALFSYYGNRGSFDAGMIISSGNVASSIIPVLGGRGITEHCKRISYGGQHLSDYMLKLLQYKYSSFPHRMTLDQAQELVKEHTYVSLDYMAELRDLAIPEKIDKQEHIIQFPFVDKVDAREAQEEAERLSQKRKEQGRRLQEMAARNREEKLQREEANLADLAELQKAKSAENRADFTVRLRSAGFQSEAELESAVKASEAAIRRIRNRMQGIEEPEEKVVPSFPLADVPDSELSEEQKKEKKKQRLLKAGWEANERKKREKEEERAREAELARQEEERRLRDPDGWLEEVRTRRQLLLDRVRARLRKKTQLTDRRSRESQMRMKNIASLAAEEAPVKRRRGGNSEDTFGANDDDWGIYREISREEDSDEDEDAVALGKLDDLLMTHDPGFVPENPFDERPFQRTIIFRLAHGPSNVDPEDPAIQNQIHLNVERIRVPEVLFQPSIVGLDQAGIIETFADILKRFSAEQQSRMVQSVLITGGNTLFTNMAQRIESDIRALRPFGSSIRILRAADPQLDAWKGAARWASSDSDGFQQSVVTRKMYDEYGHDYLVEHPMSNRYWRMNG
ncbi:hypothetical protein SpCBS45565_g03078 [Spizellomyces sp. 'palustris']|nr:hypothetical protein SpCBS45565_g03078 [Spizellomyces sp. 'palustris']